jgi:phosphoribosylformylglycinamidine synthase
VKREDGTPTGKGLALSLDCNPRFCFLDPRMGTLAAVAEAARNVACTGAVPIALTNCLNFGNPEKPEIMWQLRESIEALGEAAEALRTPVISGNVSLYNETHGTPIHPTPTIGMVGVLDDCARYAVSHFTAEGRAVLLLGANRGELGGSAWLAERRGLEAGAPPLVDLDHERRLHRLLREGVASGLVETAHDVSEGGLALALAEACFTGERCVGARITLEEGLRVDALLFGESTGRVIVATEDAVALLALADRCGVPAQEVGTTGGERLVVGPAADTAWIDAPVARLRGIWRDAIPRRLAQGGEA